MEVVAAIMVRSKNRIVVVYIPRFLQRKLDRLLEGREGSGLAVGEYYKLKSNQTDGRLIRIRNF